MADEKGSYSDKDIQQIIKRALELQKSGLPSQKTGDYSLADIEEVAGELGIPAAIVRQAAADVALGGSGGSWFLGAPPEVVSNGIVEAEFVEDDYQELMVMISGFSGGFGAGTATKRSLTWSNAPTETARRGFATEVAVESTGGITTVSVRERLGAVAGGLFGGLMGGLGIGGGFGVGAGVGLEVLGSGGWMAAIAGGAIALSYVMARTIYNSIRRGRQKETQRLAQRIVSFLEDRTTKA